MATAPTTVQQARRYRARYVDCTAIVFDGTNAAEVLAFVGGQGRYEYGVLSILIRDGENWLGMKVRQHEMVVKRPDGSLIPIPIGQISFGTFFEPLTDSATVSKEDR